MGKQWKQCQTLFLWAPKSLQMVTAAMKLKDAYPLEGKLWPTYIAYWKAETLLCQQSPSSQGYGFSSDHVWIWELDCEECWAPKNWCLWTEVLETIPQGLSALWHMVAWARWPSINLKSHSFVYCLFYMWVTRVFILSCATLIMALILSSWAQRKSSHFPIQANTHASLLSPNRFLHPRTNFLFLWPLWFHFNKNSCYLHKINK